MPKTLTPAQLEAYRAKKDERLEVIRQCHANLASYSEANKIAVSVDGREYSPTNQLTLAWQGAPAGVYGGFNSWKAKGRQVKKGEHGYFIAAPVIKKQEHEDGTTTSRMANVTTATIFHESQTEVINQ
jgi:hypothetical protein